MTTSAPCRKTCCATRWTSCSNWCNCICSASERRAAFIARDQTNKAKAAIEKARWQELGITEAIWMHSHAGKEPRPSHVAANGKRLNVNKGMYLDGKWVQPGEEINCRCTSRAVIKGFNS